jgi:hypothetical protein
MEDTSADLITWLTRWYAAQCDGGWEHQYGISIETVDNPGWRLSIDLRGTALEGRTFEAIETSDPAAGPHWHLCRVRDSKFEGFGGALDLSTIIRVFRDWVERQQPIA